MPELQAEPQIFVADPDPIINKMLLQETRDGRHAKPVLMVGLATVFVLIILFSLVTVIVLWILLDSSFLGWYGWVIAWALIFGGLAFWLDKKTNGRRWADSNLAGPIIHPLVDKIIFPLRFLVGGYQRFKAVPATSDYMAITRCAILIRDLADLAGSAPVAKLAKPGETPQYLDILIDHLSSRDWVGHSSDGLRVWLSSHAKEDMIRWGLATVPFS